MLEPPERPANNLLAFTSRVSDSAGPGRGLGISISTKFPGDANAEGLRNTL